PAGFVHLDGFEPHGRLRNPARPGPSRPRTAASGPTPAWRQHPASAARFLKERRWTRPNPAAKIPHALWMHRPMAGSLSGRQNTGPQARLLFHTAAWGPKANRYVRDTW